MTDFTPRASIVLDSVSPDGVRLTTMEVTIHRFVLPEFNTHRVFSRNSASSRAIPFNRLVEKVLAEDVVPLEWRGEKPGMQGGELLVKARANMSRAAWLEAREKAIFSAQALVNIGVHKSIANRLIEPFAPHTIIVTSTEWDGFWEQRISELAQPEIRVAAEAMKAAYDASIPQQVEEFGWHAPYIQPDESDLSGELKLAVSAARCARVSYLTHEGVRDFVKDEKLFTRLVSARPPHYSPLEHVATPVVLGGVHRGNLRGWNQLRHSYEK